MQLKAYDRFLEVGFTDEQARAIIEQQASDLVTRDHLDFRIGELRTEIEKLRNDLTWRMIGLAAVVIAGSGIVDKLIHG